MLGAVVYTLEAEKAGWLPDFTGRVMHGVFFRMLQEYSPELATWIHEKMNLKPFTVAALDLKKYKNVRGKVFLNEGDRFQWRVTGLHETVLKVMVNIEQGHIFQVNQIPMRVLHIVADGEKNPRSGFLDEEELLEGVLRISGFSRLRLAFHSPATFRVGTVDYPMPLPELVFNSLADKWQQMNMPVSINKSQLKHIIEKIYIESWSGKTGSVYLAPKRGINAFTGGFTYNVSAAAPEEQQLLLMLAQFGVFSGSGRMSAQGMGQIDVFVK